MFSFFKIGHLDSSQSFPLVVSFVLLLISILFHQKKINLSLLLLFLGTLTLGYFMANLDHFLTLWDEQYHALVAKNLSSHPLKPTLYNNPSLPYDYKNWTTNKIWLHKQPLFLWQMALSIKLFGTNEFAVRLPSIIMHAFIPLFVYRIGKITYNQRVGYYGALLFAVAFFPLELVAGRQTTDHNDLAFLFYTSASFWSWFEYQNSKRNYWLILIGLFSGSAVLVKWLMGLLVFVVWGITQIIEKNKAVFKRSNLLPILISFTISLIVFLPWQIYIHIQFPTEAAHEMAYNSLHFTEAVENHDGTFWFHLTKGLSAIYGAGTFIPILVIVSIYFFARNLKSNVYRLFYLTSLLFVYTFYSIADTKMVAFTVILTPFVYLSLGYLIFSLVQFLTEKLSHSTLSFILTSILLITISIVTLDLNQIQSNHTYWKPHKNQNRIGQEIEKEFLIQLDDKLKKENYVIFNAAITINGHISVMFYTDYEAYNYIPSREQLTQLRNQDKKVAVLDLWNLPQYILEDPNIKILKVNRFEELGQTEYKKFE